MTPKRRRILGARAAWRLTARSAARAKAARGRHRQHPGLPPEWQGLGAAPGLLNSAHEQDSHAILDRFC
jgi:hypothetical protein